jgi:hypothetical protein
VTSGRRAEILWARSFTPSPISLSFLPPLSAYSSVPNMGGRNILRNVSNNLPDYTSSHPRCQWS